MLIFEENEVLLNKVTNFAHSRLPKRLYITVVNKFIHGSKQNNKNIILAHDCGYPENSIYLTLIAGNIENLIKKFKDCSGSLWFDPFNYDSTDFRESYLTKLIPKNFIEQKYNYPREFLNWEFEAYHFGYIKKNKENNKEIIYSLPGKSFSVPITVPIKIIKSILPTDNAPKLRLVKKEEVKKEESKLAFPSNMGIISYQ